jgi:hypothetical protein
MDEFGVPPGQNICQVALPGIKNRPEVGYSRQCRRRMAKGVGVKRDFRKI